MLEVHDETPVNESRRLQYRPRSTMIIVCGLKEPY